MCPGGDRKYKGWRVIMEKVLLFLILFFAIALPTFGELTDADLDKIRLIVKDEVEKEISKTNQKIEDLDTRVQGLDQRIQSVEKDVSWVRGKLDGMEEQISHATNVTYGLIALIVVAIGILAWRGKRDRDQERKIQELTQEIETLKQIVNP
jgi:septal ring factor EnvC (AmiA/AmiB activator)